MTHSVLYTDSSTWFPEHFFYFEAIATQRRRGKSYFGDILQLMNNITIDTFCTNVMDDYNREGLGIEVDPSLQSARVIRSLDQIIE